MITYFHLGGLPLTEQTPPYGYVLALNSIFVCIIKALANEKLLYM